MLSRINGESVECRASSSKAKGQTADNAKMSERLEPPRKRKRKRKKARTHYRRLRDLCRTS